MTEYTPSDRDIEDSYASTWLGFQNELGRKYFRDWLAAHDARVRRDAWNEGVEAFEVAHKIDNIEPWAHLRDNPYEETP